MNQFKFCIFFLIILSNCGKKPETVNATYTDIVESVYASATVKAENQYSLKSTISGKITKYFVQEGDVVKANDPIAILENTSPELNFRNADLAVANAEANLSQVDEFKANLNTMKKQLDLDSLNYFRQVSLWKNEIGTKLQLEQSKLKYESSKNNWMASLKKLKTLIIQLNSALSQAKNNKNIAGKNNEDFIIRSFIDGRVYTLPFQIGESVSPQQEFAVLGDKDQFMIELEIDEVDISKIQIGQDVSVKLEAYEKPVSAEITKIYPSLNAKSQTFRVEAKFKGNLPKLYPGLTAEANIVIQTKKHALTIPLAYLVDEEFVLIDKKKQKVKTGLRNFNSVEIIEGLDANTKITKP